MILPVADRRINDRIPFVTYLLLGLNTLVFLLTLAHRDRDPFTMYGLIPAELHPASFLTYQFLHATVEHLVFNMIFLWFFGCNTERRVGPVPFLLLYLTLGSIAGGMFLPFAVDKDIPLVGASGAVAGLIGLYSVLFPKRQIRLVYWIILYAGTFRVGALWFGLVYLAYQIPYAIWLSELDQVAYWAHIGGFFAGALLMLPLAHLMKSKLHAITEPEQERPYAESYEEFNYLPQRQELDPVEDAPPEPREVATRFFSKATLGAFTLIGRAFVPITPDLTRRLSALGGVSRPPRPHCLLTTLVYHEALMAQNELRRLGIKSLIYPAREVLRDPVVIHVTDIQSHDRMLVAIDEFKQVHTRGSGSYKIVVAARLGKTVAIDLVASKPISTMRWKGAPEAAPAVAGRIAATLHGVPYTRSFLELSKSGQLPHRTFEVEEAYAEYVIWAAQLVTTPIYRVKKRDPITAVTGTTLAQP